LLKFWNTNELFVTSDVTMYSPLLDDWILSRLGMARNLVLQYLVWQMLNPLCIYNVLTLGYSQIWLYCSYLYIYQHIMPKVKQPNSLKVRSILLLRLESSGGKCANLHAVAESINRDHAPWSLLLLVYAIYMGVVLRAHPVHCESHIQCNINGEVTTLHEYASEFTSTPTGELFCKFCNCLVKQRVYGGSKSLQCKA